MNRYIILIFLILTGCSVWAPLQKSKIISVFHLIETAKFNEAKGVVEEMINDEKSARWYRTWYARGHLCQTAYRAGISRNDRKLSELYPDQLFEAFISYERAFVLDRTGRLNNKFPPKYIMLANDFQRLGEREYSARKYKEALRAFEHALEISRRPILSVPTDTNLIYNTALAAYESKEWEKAVRHLTRLHNYHYSKNATHLLFNSLLQQGDTPGSIRIISEGIERYEEEEDMVFLLADLYLKSNDPDGAIRTLNKAISRNPSNFMFHNTKGLVYQREGDFHQAILAFYEAVDQAPDEMMPYINIARCFYNIGVEIEADSRTLTNISAVRVEQSRSTAAFESAISWLDKVFEQEPSDKEILSEMLQLYQTLRVTEKVDILLIYGEALAAYESKEWEKGFIHLARLHNYQYSKNATRVLFNALLQHGDTLEAIRVMNEGIELYSEEVKMVLMLTDLYLKSNDPESAISTLNKAISRNPSSYSFHNTKGLVYLRAGDFHQALSSFIEAVEQAPDELMTYINIAKCYYNIGIKIEANARNLNSISAMRIEQSKSATAFEFAVSWLDKVFENEPSDMQIIAEMIQLYRVLGVTSKVAMLEKMAE